MARKRILIIEDNAANLELMRYLLCASGYEILTAINGRVGMAAAERERPDLIICDVQMPEMNGYELAQAMSSHEQLGHVPLVAVTAFAMVGDQEKALASGFDAYISKPIDPVEFASQIGKLLPVELHTASGKSRLRSE